MIVSFHNGRASGIHTDHNPLPHLLLGELACLTDAAGEDACSSVVSLAARGRSCTRARRQPRTRAGARCRVRRDLDRGVDLQDGNMWGRCRRSTMTWWRGGTDVVHNRRCGPFVVARPRRGAPRGRRRQPPACALPCFMRNTCAMRCAGPACPSRHWRTDGVIRLPATQSALSIPLLGFGSRT